MTRALIRTALPSVIAALAACAVLTTTPVRAASPWASDSHAAVLPADSVYQLPVMLTDQQGRRQPFGARRGRPQLISMFYTSCEFVCPMLVEAMNATRAQLSEAERAGLPVLMVSFDPARDSVAALQHAAEQRGLDPNAWTLARTDARSVRQLAAVLGIQYRALPNGDFNHSTVLILVDADGRLMARTTRLGDADPAFVEKVRAVVNPAGTPAARR